MVLGRGGKSNFGRESFNTESRSEWLTDVLKVSSATSVDKAFILLFEASPCMSAEPCGISSSPGSSGLGDVLLRATTTSDRARIERMNANGKTNGGREFDIPLSDAGSMST